MVDFEEIWKRIGELEGDIFTQIRGGEFTYELSDSALKPNRTNQNIPKKHFKEASELLPFSDTVPLQHLRGPSYIFAVLMDRRVRKSDW